MPHFERGAVLAVSAILGVALVAGGFAGATFRGPASLLGRAGAGGASTSDAGIRSESPPQSEAYPSPSPDMSEFFDPEPTELPPGVRLADVPDPNVVSPDYAPLRAEELGGRRAVGPRLAIAGLNAAYSLDLGCIEASEPVSGTVVLSNVGTAPLLISRLYAGSATTTLSVDGLRADAAGWLPAPVVLMPLERRLLLVQYDPALAVHPTRRLAVMYLQLFTNDSTNEMFDQDDPASHEVRIRVTVENGSRAWRRERDDAVRRWREG